MSDTVTIPFPVGAALIAAVEQNTDAVQSMLNGHWFTRRGSVADIAIVSHSIQYSLA